jgi:hypothetical protein
VSLEPTEAELLREVIESRLADVHTSIPGRIVKYDAATQTADVEIVIQRAEQSESGTIVHETFPVIPNVPVGWQSGGGYSFQFPLAVGDGVWLLFSEAAIANWRETGDVSPPGDLDRFDISYPIALPCARPRSKALVTATTAYMVVPSGGSLRVTVDSPGNPAYAVPLDNRLQTELNRIKDDIASLKTAIGAGFTAVGAGAAANGPAGKTAFDSSAIAIPSDVGTTASSTLKAQ